MRRTPFRAVATLALSFCLASGMTYAQESEQYEADPPSRAARLSYISGDVSLQPVGEEDWAPALLNRPLTSGDKLWTEHNARAEIYVGPAAVRLDGETGFSFLNVDDHTVQMRMTAGTVNVSIRTLEGSEQIEIDTPNVAVSLLRAGNYRVEVNDAGDTTVVKVSDGAAQATGGSQDTVVHAEQEVTFSGLDDVVVQTRTLGAPDDFDSWTRDRDQRDSYASTSRTAEYVSPDVTGYQDLDDNGTWSSEPEYGYVWTPSRVAVGWAPYSYGRWVWVAPWGYTWIDNAPWGYAPFHYGRWAHVRNRWCWVPGPRHVRAVYAPALVGWVGSPGAHVSWFPLGPREVYVPSRRYSRHYVERVNVANTIVNRMFIAQAYDKRGANFNYRNRVAPGGVTTASRAAFTAAGRISGRAARANDPAMVNSPATAMAPQIAPARESRFGGQTRANLRRPPQSVVDRQVVVRRDPPPAAARFARNPGAIPNRVQTTDRPARPSVRSDVRETPARSIANDVVARERPDRPPRVARPVGESSPPPTRSSVYDRRALVDRVREDRDRQVREGQQREAAFAQRENRDAQVRQQRESQQQQQQLREMIQRQQAPERQMTRPPEQRERPAPRERDYERPRAEAPRERAVQPRAEQPRAEQPRAQQPRAQQPREERPQVERSRSESRTQRSR